MKILKVVLTIHKNNFLGNRELIYESQIGQLAYGQEIRKFILFFLKCNIVFNVVFSKM